jgi:SAM-dependent methyltransferase
MSSLTSAAGVELLDDPSADPAAVAESLRHIGRANRWLGGAWAARWGLDRALSGVPRGTTLSLLDIGTGLGDLPRAARRWAATRGIVLRPAGLERSGVAARLAAAEGLPMVIGDAGRLPFADRSVDIVLLSQVAHHFAPGSAAALFRSCDRIARRAVVVADLRRSAAAAAGFSLAAGVMRFDAVTVADGRTSIRRGYTTAELAQILATAGIDATISARPLWRVVAIWRPAA